MVFISDNHEPRSPERSCIVCRDSSVKQSFVRLALIQNQLCFDLRHKLPGRGCYICARKSCLEKAFSSAIKRATKHDPSELARDVTSFVADILMPGLRKRIIECLTSGFQAGQLLLGADAVEEAAKNNKLACYVLAFDISDGGHHKYAENAKRKDIPCITGQFHAAFYGKLFNKSDKSVLGWLPGTLCDIWMHCNQALQSLSFEFGNVLGDVDSLADENSILKQLQIQLPTA